MRKLLKKLQKWYIKQEEPPTLSLWQRETFFDHIIEFANEAKKYNKKIRFEGIDYKGGDKK